MEHTVVHKGEDLTMNGIRVFRGEINPNALHKCKADIVAVQININYFNNNIVPKHCVLFWQYYVILSTYKMPSRTDM